MQEDRPRILALDDDSDILHLLSLQLGDEYEVTTVGKYHEAIAKLKEGRYHLILSDFNLHGEKNGYDFLLEAKNLSPSTSRIMITGNPNVDLAKKLINNAGIKGFLIKPWTEEELFDVVRREIDTVLSEKVLMEEYVELKKFVQTLSDDFHDSSTHFLEKLDETKDLAGIRKSFSEYIGDIQSTLDDVGRSFIKSIQEEYLSDLNFLDTFLDDMIIFAKEFELHSLLKYFYLLKFYSSVLQDDTVGSFTSYQNYNLLKSTSLIFQNVSDILPDVLNQILLDKTQRNPDILDRNFLLSGLESLLSIRLNDLLDSESIELNYTYSKLDHGYSISIFKDDLVIYSYSSGTGDRVNNALVGNFVFALEGLFNEVFCSEKRLGYITTDLGEILLHTKSGVDFLVLSNFITIKLRVGLRRFAEAAYEHVCQLHQGEGVSGNTKQVLDQLARQTLGSL